MRTIQLPSDGRLASQRQQCAQNCRAVRMLMIVVRRDRLPRASNATIENCIEMQRRSLARMRTGSNSAAAGGQHRLPTEGPNYHWASKRKDSTHCASLDFTEEKGGLRSGMIRMSRRKRAAAAAGLTSHLALRHLAWCRSRSRSSRRRCSSSSSSSSSGGGPNNLTLMLRDAEASAPLMVSCLRILPMIHETSCKGDA